MSLNASLLNIKNIKKQHCLIIGGKQAIYMKQNGNQIYFEKYLRQLISHTDRRRTVPGPLIG